MSSPLTISVVVPNFNSGAVIGRALESILNQSHPHVQLIVVDSLSTDESGAIIESYHDQIDVLIREKDQGQADGLNKGFERATGDVLCWLCADDEYLPGTLARVAALFASRRDCEVVIGGCERVFEDGSRHVTTPPTDALAIAGIKDLIEQPSCFWRASLYERSGPLNTTFHLAFDWDLWCRFHAAGAVAHIDDQVFSRYYFTADNKTSKSGLQFVEEASKILSRYGPLDGRIASVYRFLFTSFDMHGCYDSPPTCSQTRFFAFRIVREALRRSIGQRLTDSYNWQFAARQARGIKWW